MKTYKNLYTQLCSYDNLELAFKKARKRNAKKFYVRKFEENLDYELQKLKQELGTLSYIPIPLKRFIIREPKTRTIHSSAFRDRVVHHALVNLLEPIFERVFICDSYASRIEKGSHKAVARFDKFKRKISRNGKLIKNYYNKNNIVGYILKADIKHYFNTVDHNILLKIIKRKIKDEKVLWLIKRILNNFNARIKGKGMPLGNLTSQFFANVYLNELDYFIKHNLRAKYYIRYVDDFVILHKSKDKLKEYQSEISNFLKDKLTLRLHPSKSKIIPLKKGVGFLGYKIFYYHKLLRKSNLLKFKKRFREKLEEYDQGDLNYSDLIKSLRGWFGYAIWANTYEMRRKILNTIQHPQKTTTTTCQTQTTNQEYHPQHKHTNKNNH